MLKRPAGVWVGFDIDKWINDNIGEDEAAKTEQCRYFTSKTHHRVTSDARRAGIPDDKIPEPRDKAREAAREVCDKVHPPKPKKGKHR